MRGFRRNILLFQGLLILFTGCKKYPQAALLSNPAYLRVFNDIPFVVNFLSAGQSRPFYTFIIDPVNDKDGAPVTGLFLGDFLTTRYLYSLSYPLDAGNLGREFANPSQIPLNYEYPGTYNVLTAPSINGLELSSWAQVPSGKHRLVFVARDYNGTPFNQLPSSKRKQLAIDTTVNLQAGEVYTAEAVSKDLDRGQDSLYMRRESFIHEAFDSSKLYCSVYNLSGKTPAILPSPGYPFLDDTLSLFYSYNITRGNLPFPIYQNYINYNRLFYTTITKKFQQNAPYFTLPLLDRSYFFDPTQDTLYSYSYSQKVDGYPFGFTPSNGQFNAGTFPYLSLEFLDQYGKASTFNFIADPKVFNYDANYNPSLVSGYYAGSVTAYNVNINLIVNTNKDYQAYPSVNIIELVYDRTYLMQIQRVFKSH